jgi:hypothetical protein
MESVESKLIALGHRRIEVTEADLLKIINAKLQETQDLADGKAPRKYINLIISGCKMSVVEIEEDEQDVEVEEHVDFTEEKPQRLETLFEEDEENISDK